MAENVNLEPPIKKVRSESNTPDNDQNNITKDCLKNQNQIVDLTRPIKPVVMEINLGIELYLGDAKNSFHGLIKCRYADFIVHEIDLEGNSAHLTNTNIPQDEEVEEKESPKLDNIINQEQIDSIEAVRKGHIPEIKIEVTNMDKEARTKLHHAISSSFDRLDSTTIIDPPNPDSNDEPSKYILIKRKGKSTRKKNIWPRDRSQFTHFVLYKENKDTMDAIGMLASCLHIKPTSFGYSGTKDRRAVTSQWISCWQMEPSRLLNAAKRFSRFPCLKVGNFSFKKQPLKLGQLKANKFEVAIRNIVYDNKDVIEESMNSIVKNGFINYFGLQRFGTYSNHTFEIGLAILQEKWETAVDLIMAYRYDDSTNNNSRNRSQLHNQAIDMWRQTKDPARVLREFPQLKYTNEGTILRWLSRQNNEKDYCGAIISLPRNVRSIYVHSYQSLIWNKVASYRIKKYGHKVIIGDILLKDENTLDSICEDIPFGQELKTCESSTEKQPVDDKISPLEDLEFKITVVTEDNICDSSIEDVVIPLIGSKSKITDNDIGVFMLELLKNDGLSIESFKVREKLFLSYGSYRKMIVKPSDVEWSLKSYSDPNQNLIETDLDRLGHELDKKTVLPTSDSNDEALIVSFTLPPSAYATMCLREIMKTPSTNFNKLA